MLLIVPRSLVAGDPPIICRTPGQAEADGIGTCGRFTAMAWAKSFIVAIEGKAGRVHIFDPRVVSDGFPRRGVNICSIEAPGTGICQAFACELGERGVTVVVGRGKVTTGLKWKAET